MPESIGESSLLVGSSTQRWCATYRLTQQLFGEGAVAQSRRVLRGSVDQDQRWISQNRSVGTPCWASQ